MWKIVKEKRSGKQSDQISKRLAKTRTSSPVSSSFCSVRENECPTWLATVHFGDEAFVGSQLWSTLVCGGALLRARNTTSNALVVTSAAALAHANGGTMPATKDIRVSLGQGVLTDNLPYPAMNYGALHVLVPAAWSVLDPYKYDVAVLILDIAQDQLSYGTEVAPFAQTVGEPYVCPIAYRYFSHIADAGGTYGVLQKTDCATLSSALPIPEPALSLPDEYVAVSPSFRWWDRGLPFVSQAGLVVALLTGNVQDTLSASIAYKVASGYAHETIDEAGGDPAIAPSGNLTRGGSFVTRALTDALACYERVLPISLWRDALRLPDVRKTGHCPLCTDFGKPKSAVPDELWCACCHDPGNVCGNVCGCGNPLIGKPWAQPINFDLDQVEKRQVQEGLWASGNATGCLTGGQNLKQLPPFGPLKPSSTQYTGSAAFHAQTWQSLNGITPTPVYGKRKVQPVVKIRYSNFPLANNS